MKNTSHNISKNLRLLHNQRVLDDLQTDHSELDHKDEAGLVHAFSSCPYIPKDNSAIQEIYGHQMDSHFTEAERKVSIPGKKTPLRLVR